MKHPWLSRSFLPPSSSPQTERKSKRDVQRAPQKTLEKQNFSLSFTAFSFLLMFNFPSLLSLGVFFLVWGFFSKALFGAFYNPPAFSPGTFPSLGCCGKHPCCRKRGDKSHPMAKTPQRGWWGMSIRERPSPNMIYGKQLHILCQKRFWNQHTQMDYYSEESERSPTCFPSPNTFQALWWPPSCALLPPS